MAAVAVEEWNAENLKTKGVMFVADTNILFIDEKHPIIAKQPPVKDMLFAISGLEHCYKVNGDVFHKQCDALALEWASKA